MKASTILTWVLVLTLGVFAAAAQSDPSTDGLWSVVINRVDSSAFPQVTAFVSVLDERRQPVLGLTAADFQVTEAGRILPGEMVGVYSDADQNLGLVLVIDTSLTPNNHALPFIQDAARAFLRKLDSQSQVAVVTTWDEVNLIQPFTDPLNALAAIDELTAQGRITRLNQAMVEAVKLAATCPLERRAIVVIYDCLDNAGDLAFKDALAQVQAAAVPVYTVGFGPKIDRSRLNEITSLTDTTGGLYFVMNTASEIQPPLQSIALTLRQGYRLTFMSNVPADDAAHSLTVTLWREGQSLQAEADLKASRRSMGVRFTGLTADQTVGGVVSAGIAADAPGDLTRVRYLLDGQLLSETSEPPFGLVWDSTTTALGAHTLTVQAWDHVGNQGQADIRVVVALPVTVSLQANVEQVRVGEAVRFQAQVKSLTEIAQVEWTVDGQVAETQVASPGGDMWAYTWDTLPWSSGYHVISVRARDRLGQEAQSSVRVYLSDLPTPTPAPTYTPTPIPTPRSIPARVRDWSDGPGRPWIRGVMLVGLGLLILVLAALITMLVVFLQKRHWRKVFKLEITNAGNMPNTFDLCADDPTGHLRLQFYHRKVLLVQKPETVTETVEPEPAPVSAAAASASPRKTPAQLPAASARPGAMAQARRQVGRVSYLGGMLADLLSAFGFLVPRSMKSGFYQMVGRLRGAQMAAAQVDNAASRVSQAGQTAAWATSAASRSPAERALPPVAGQTPAAGPDVARQPRQRTRSRTWYRTPTIEPGEQVVFDLISHPGWIYRTRLYEFAVICRPNEPADAVCSTEQRSLQIKGVSWFWRFVPYALICGIAAVLLYLLIRLASAGFLSG